MKGFLAIDVLFGDVDFCSVDPPWPQDGKSLDDLLMKSDCLDEGDLTDNVRADGG